MTCIVGYIDQPNSVMYIASDSAFSSGDQVMVKSTKKIFCKKKMLIGLTGYPRLLQLVEWKMEFPLHRKHVEPPQYIIDFWVDDLRSCLKEHGFNKNIEGQEKFVDSELLICYQGKLFNVQPNYQVIEPLTHYYAVGSGEEYAMGALHVLDQECHDMTPTDKIRLALEAAAEHVGSVAPPFYQLQLKYEN